MRKLFPAAPLPVALGVIAALMAVQPAAAQYGMDKKPPKTAATPQLPHCVQPLGRAAIQEPETRWWTELGLSNPETLIKLFAARSNCLRIVDRNAGLAMRNQEADLGRSGDLQRGSNVGRGQVAAADFFLIPNIANADSNTGGEALGAIAGALGGSRLGGIAGGLRTKRAEAQAILTLVDARTTEQLYVAEGVAKKTDITFGGGVGGGGWGGFAAAAGGGYADTDIGKVVTAAYFNAFIDLVGYLQGGAPTGEQASQAAGIQAYTVKQALVMRASPSTSARQVRGFAAGDLVYPTGRRDGVWWEVDDETGNRGWVSSVFLSPR
ncbi:CsgG/HfaB family protein [Phenylobacterium sp.]|uniref:CsgG/HfaB family protein n=1 Tax=Phenylobacterium sp. TaxID=1871053 RepID=UPI0039233A06